MACADTACDLVHSAASIMGLPSATPPTQSLSQSLLPSDSESRNPTPPGVSSIKTEPKSSSHGPRTNASNDKVPKKRGRPRLYLGDQEAADRRREQVRAAQQAYRLRKEKAITDLTERVSHLEKTIICMNRAFLDFQTSLKDSGILSSRPELAIQLQKTQDRLMVLTDDANVDSESRNEDVEEQKPSSSKPSRMRPATVSSPANGHNEHATPSTSSNTATISAPSSSAASSTTTAPPTTLPSSTAPLEQDAFGLSTADLSPFLDSVQDCVNGGSNSYMMQSNSEQYYPQTTTNQFLQDLTSTASMNTPVPRNQGSALLSEFATRVFRTCVEKAIAVLRDDSFPNHILQKIFGPLLNTFTKQELSQTFVYRLQTGMIALPLVNVDAPFVKNWTAADWAVALGLEGRWFFIHEVEQYLLQRGINVTGNSSYAWVNPELLDFTNLYQSMSSKDEQSQPSASGLNGSPYDSGFSANQFAFAFQQMPLDETSGQSDWWKPRDIPSSVKRSLVLDVNRFISELTNRAICLGRSPGFNQRDVDTSIVLSIIQSF